MTTPDLQLRTMFVLDEGGRITATREPSAAPPPLFCFVRGAKDCVWAIRDDVSDDIATELDALAAAEQPIADLRAPPAHTERYAALLGGRVLAGPALSFPETLPDSGNVHVIVNLQPLERHLRGWVTEEIPGRSLVIAILEDGHAVSVCCCARRSAVAAEAGLETAEAFRGRGLGPRVTAAWALAVRASGRTPLYCTSWDNHASLAVARKLRLQTYASSWSISE